MKFMATKSNASRALQVMARHGSVTQVTVAEVYRQ